MGVLSTLKKKQIYLITAHKKGEKKGSAAVNKYESIRFSNNIRKKIICDTRI